MKITLMSGKKKIRTPFKLKEESIRFFHKEYGYLVPAGSIGKGEFTPSPPFLHS